MNKFELRLKYKAETSQAAKPMTAYARCGKYGDVILDQYECDPRIVALLAENGEQREISFPDPKYHQWLEEKLMELL